MKVFQDKILCAINEFKDKEFLELKLIWEHRVKNYDEEGIYSMCALLLTLVQKDLSNE